MRLSSRLEHYSRSLLDFQEGFSEKQCGPVRVADGSARVSAKVKFYQGKVIFAVHRDTPKALRLFDGRERCGMQSSFVILKTVELQVCDWLFMFSSCPTKLGKRTSREKG